MHYKTKGPTNSASDSADASQLAKNLALLASHVFAPQRKLRVQTSRTTRGVKPLTQSGKDKNEKKK